MQAQVQVTQVARSDLNYVNTSFGLNNFIFAKKICAMSKNCSAECYLTCSCRLANYIGLLSCEQILYQQLFVSAQLAVCSTTNKFVQFSSIAKEYNHSLFCLGG